MNRDGLELVRRLRRGDPAAFDEFFEQFFRRLYRFALPRLGHDHDGAEEVVQEALCRAISKIDTYRGEAALFTWLCTFCRHEISAFFRKAGRQPPAVDLLEDSREIAAALDSMWAVAGEGPDEALRRDETARLVHVVLDRLPDRYGDVLEWKYMDELSVGEIATRLALSPKAAESLLTRARRSFRDGFSALIRAGGPPAPAAGESS